MLAEALVWALAVFEWARLHLEDLRQEATVDLRRAREPLVLALALHRIGIVRRHRRRRGEVGDRERRVGVAVEWRTGRQLVNPDLVKTSFFLSINQALLARVLLYVGTPALAENSSKQSRGEETGDNDWVWRARLLRIGTRPPTPGPNPDCRAPASPSPTPDCGTHSIPQSPWHLRRHVLRSPPCTSGSHRTAGTRNNRLGRPLIDSPLQSIAAPSVQEKSFMISLNSLVGLAVEEGKPGPGLLPLQTHQTMMKATRAVILWSSWIREL